jgi:hypothetical protein
MAAAVILQIDELLQFGSSSPENEEIWYTHQEKFIKYQVNSKY